VPTIRQIAAAAVVSGVAVASLAAPSAATTKTKPSKLTSPAGYAAGYLARELIGPHHDHYLYAGTKYSDDGGTADAILSMDAAGVALKAANRATTWLQKDIANYAIGSPTDYPGSTAKLLLVAEAQRVDPRNFGGVDLVHAIKASEGAGGAPAGEFQQSPGFPSPTSYVVDQALPVLALSNLTFAGSHPDAAAVEFLVRQQCPDGGYQTTIRNQVGGKCSAPDPDDTGYAIQALIAAGGHGPAVARGLAYLKRIEHANGGFGTPANANSTALAVEALVAGGKSIRKPQAWLLAHQIGCGGKPARRGAITFENKYDASALLATTQAATALAGKSLLKINSRASFNPAPVMTCPKKK
jgi:hypothetical protein